MPKKWDESLNKAYKHLPLKSSTQSWISKTQTEYNLSENPSIKQSIMNKQDISRI